jgi:hypothetical protein
MRIRTANMVVWILVAGLCLALTGCGPKHRLKEYDFNDLTAAAMVDAPAEAGVFTGSLLDIAGHHPLAIALQAGAALAKEITADGAQARLDSAMMQVDVPERIRSRTLRRCADYLRLQSVPVHNRADFLFDVYIHDYGIDAEAWDAGVYFYIDAQVYLLDNGTGSEIWKTHVKERLPVTRRLFPSEVGVADDVVSAIALSQLSVDEIAAGFRHLANETADRVAARLRRDYAKSRKDRPEETQPVQPTKVGQVSALQKHDILAELQPLYGPSGEQVGEVHVPPMHFLMVDGAGDPNTSPEYRDAVAALYELSFVLKFMVMGNLGVDYQVMPLEGLWWADDMSQFSLENKDAWKWTAMIMQPDFVTAEMVAEAKREVSAKKDLSALERVRLETFYEGRAAQILYAGPYADEGPTVGKIHGYIFSQGHRPTGKHHEIYLNDPAQTPPEELRTIIRQPFE